MTDETPPPEAPPSASVPLGPGDHARDGTTQRSLKGRTAWHLRANAGVVFWLLALLYVTVMHRFLPVPNWLMVHLLLLGAVTNAILVWSNHFADALLRGSHVRAAAAGQITRLVAANIGIAAVVGGMMADHWRTVLVGGIVVGAAVAWHAVVLGIRMRRALPSRFKPTVRYYLFGAALLPFGVAAGILLAEDIAHDRLVITHLAVNLLGWVGLTVLGTLITLWPTMLRTKVVEGAERTATPVLYLLTGSVLVIAVAALIAPPQVALVGVLGFLAGVVTLSVAFVAEARTKPPAEYATYSVLSGLAWLVVSLVWLALLAATASDWGQVAAGLGVLVGPFVAGFAAQILLGALSYLIPVVTGGGPVAVRAANTELNRGAAWRVSLISSGIAVWVLPVPSLVAVVASSLALVGFAMFLPLLARALWKSYRARRDDRPAPSLAERRAAAAQAQAARTRPGRFAGPAAAGFVVVALSIAVAVAMEPASVGAAPVDSAAGEAGETGVETVVDIVADNMRFTPDRIEVPAGNRLILNVTNADTMVHDLVLDTRATTGRIAPGDTATIDVGVVGRDIDGWCSIIGHRQLGMVMSITAIGGGPAPGDATDGDSGHGGADDADAMAGMDHGAMADGPSAAEDLDFFASPAPGFTAYDASLPPAPAATTHRITLTVTDEEIEVAPGVTQTLWVYGRDGAPGTMPGPTLRGKIGDTFVITLVNSGDIGHSIDFHAGELAPDLPMRTIGPGESLEYTFTANRSGIWLYHCSTMPMSHHIANGMFGAVIIDPPDLAPVDEEYVLVASELYLGPQGGYADMDKIVGRSPDAYVFNGYVNGYDADPLTATVGDRVRVWILAAGPNEPLAFHIVGTQFDTVFFEGSYQLRPGMDGAGGGQTVALAAAQGGFVELTAVEAGHYPIVSHIMSNAEAGQHGTLKVSER